MAKARLVADSGQSSSHRGVANDRLRILRQLGAVLLGPVLVLTTMLYAPDAAAERRLVAKGVVQRAKSLARPLVGALLLSLTPALAQAEPGSHAQPWKFEPERRWQGVFQEAERRGIPVMIITTVDWCPSCIGMKKEAYGAIVEKYAPKPEDKSSDVACKALIRVIDMDSGRHHGPERRHLSPESFLSSLGVEYFANPTTAIVAADGTFVGDTVGYDLKPKVPEARIADILGRIDRILPGCVEAESPTTD